MAEERKEESTPLVRLVGGRTNPFKGLDWALREGRSWALVGADGAAKSLFCAVVGQTMPPPRGTRVEFSDEMDGRVQIVSFAQQRDAAQKGGFLQARYHSIVDEAGPGDTVEEFLSFDGIFDVNPFEVGRPLKAERAAYRRAFTRVRRLLNLRELLDRDLLALSNGETRRVLLARALLANPRVLVLDDPCAGLDPDRREQVKKIFDALAARGLALVVSVRHEDEIPSCVTDRLRFGKEPPPPKPKTVSACPRKTLAAPLTSGRAVIEINDLHIAFGRRKLFDGFSWTVRSGERWVLRGANGSGKTTLLSLIVGDNPQAYANDVRVFGLPREPGVELSRIRRRIGMVSPEQQAYLGRGPLELLEEALKRRPALLLLDEPCLNLDEREADRLKTRVASWLAAHPACTAICVAHRPEDVPPGFTHTLQLEKEVQHA